MTVAELIAKLQLMPSDAIVSIYESEPDAYVDVSSLELMEPQLEVRLYTGLETA